MNSETGTGGGWVPPVTTSTTWFGPPTDGMSSGETADFRNPLSRSALRRSPFRGAGPTDRPPEARRLATAAAACRTRWSGEGEVRGVDPVVGVGIEPTGTP